MYATTTEYAKWLARHVTQQAAQHTIKTGIKELISNKFIHRSVESTRGANFQARMFGFRRKPPKIPTPNGTLSSDNFLSLVVDPSEANIEYGNLPVHISDVVQSLTDPIFR